MQACLTEATFGIHGLPQVQDKRTFVMVYDSDPELVSPGELYPEPQFFDVPLFCGYNEHILGLLDTDHDGNLSSAEIHHNMKMLYEVSGYFA